MELATGTCNGLYRALVADTNDPQQRKRYRVRVINIHRDEVPTESLPWAEWCLFGGKGFGDVPHLESGDAVFVMFEGGDRRFPVIMGGWLSYSGGTSDLPNELTGEYDRTQQRWVRIDRVGNKIEMSPLPDEQWIRLQSGDSTVTVRGLDGTVEVESDSRVVVRAPKVDVDSAIEVTVQADRLLAQVAETATVQCDDVVNVQAANTINIGRYQAPATALAPPLPELTGVVDVQAQTLARVQSAQKVEILAGTSIEHTAPTDITQDAGANVNIHAGAKVRITCLGPVEVEGQSFALTTLGGKAVLQVATDCEIHTFQKVLLDAQGDVDVRSASGHVDVQAAGDVDVTAGGSVEVVAGGNARVTSAGLLRAESGLRLELAAPTIRIEAQALLQLLSTGVVEVDGSTVLLGT